jgi:hypothetical protein
MSDPNGVPFTVAPVRSEDPKKKQQQENGDDHQDGDGSNDKKQPNGDETATKQGAGADGKEEEELVSSIRPCLKDSADLNGFIRNCASSARAMKISSSKENSRCS